MSSRSSGVMNTRSSRVDHLVGDLVGLVLQPLDLVDDRAAPVVLGPQQVLLQPGRLDGEGGDRGEEVEELLVAGQQAHCHIQVTGRREDNALPERWPRTPAASLTPPVSPPDSGVDVFGRLPERGPSPVCPAAMTQVIARPPARQSPRGGLRPAHAPGGAAARRAGRAGHLAGRRPGLLQERRRLAGAVGQRGAARRSPTPSAATWSRPARRWWSRTPAGIPLVRSNPAIRELRWIAYAGVPLTTGDGQTAGALCVIDALPADLVAAGRGAAARIWPRRWSPRSSSARPPRREPAASGRAAAPGAAARPRSRRRRVRRLRAAHGPRASPTAAGSGSIARWPSCWARRPRRSPAARPRRCHPSRRPRGRPRGHAAAPGRRVRQLHARRSACSGTASEPVWVLATVTPSPTSRDAGPLPRRAPGHHRPQAGRAVDLRAREERYRLAAEATQDAVWDWDLLTDRIVWGEPADGKLRLPRTRGPARSAAWWYERLHADDRERVVSGIHAAIARGRHGVDRRVPLPPRRRALRPGARPRRDRPRRGGRRRADGRRG